MTNEITDFKKAIKSGIVRFSFYKKDGSKREAVGTTCESIITERGGSMPNGKGISPSSVCTYWDIERSGWRSFKTENLISFESYN